jgi:signal transduction histidine kinase
MRILVVEDDAKMEVPKTADELRMLARLNSSVQRASQFTADASHELRAPVSLIRTTAELAVKGGAPTLSSHRAALSLLESYCSTKYP